MIICATQYGGAAALALPQFSCTGTPPTLYQDADGDWELVFLRNCTITFQRIKTPVEIFMVGGGASGKSGAHKEVWATWDGVYGMQDNATGGDGGGGGERVTTQSPVTLTPGTTYHINIGESGVSTSIPELGLSAAAGTVGGGATGAVAYKGNQGSPRVDAGSADDGSLAFGTGGTLYENGTPIYFGAEGGGGSAFSLTLGGSSADASAGGDTGGGDGGSNGSGTAGTPGTGSGAGGGAACTDGSGAAGGLGGSGIVIMRNARSNT